MSATSLGLGIKFAWFKAPDLEFWKWSRAAQRLWAWLKRTTHGDQTRFRVTDRELAKELGIGRRCVQYALEWLEAHGIITRWYEYGPRHVAGRVIEITIELAGKATPTRPAAPTNAPTPTPAIKVPEPEPEPVTFTPEEQAEAQKVLDEIRARRERQESQPRGRDHSVIAKGLLRDIQLTTTELDQIRQLDNADTDPAIQAEIERLEQMRGTIPGPSRSDHSPEGVTAGRPPDRHATGSRGPPAVVNDAPTDPPSETTRTLGAGRGARRAGRPASTPRQFTYGYWVHPTNPNEPCSTHSREAANSMPKTPFPSPQSPY